MQTILVTGSSGFIGTHLIRRLASEGARIVAVDILPPRLRLENVDYRTADVRNLETFDPGCEIDTIYNFAAIHTTPGHDTHEYYETNVAGALQVTKLAERIGTKDIVFTSSISVYGPGEDMKTEQSPPAPISSYGRSKLLAEQVHRQWQERDTSRKLTIVRPAVVFGEGEGGNFTRLAALLKKGFFVFPGRKDTIKACIHVQDLLDSMHFAHARPEKVLLFNGAYPDRYTLEQIINVMIREHFPGTRTFVLPQGMVTLAARLLGAVGFLNIGIHPDRVTKLVRSTDIYPAWLMNNGFEFPKSFNSVTRRWHNETNGTFI